MDSKALELQALTTLRRGFLYLAVASLMIIVGMASIIGVFFFARGSVVRGLTEAAILFFITAVFIGGVVALYAVFKKIRPGMRQLASVDKSFGICYTGTNLILAGFIMLILGLLVGAVALMTTRAGILVFLGAYMAALAITFIGYILSFIVGAFKLNAKYGIALFTAAGVVYILDAVVALSIRIGLLSAVGHFLMYIALGRASLAQAKG
ncbi:DUF973 family protein [Pyrobaculum aerophilum]|uniref:Conserved within P. aerophilum n=2 Tax=Pyrobaculum aerophilum TaxID=13773 RepID=Q8ZUE7_PYRAE|nr:MULTISPECIES: DUF973 family protein [Pyrobaculum]AAL64460.1 conserved within P. aerophilum [Pyrobaculum aerophilum str. IM2]MCX8137327.1 DUF973 family protein [Pyrobaculum aerophilum]HII47314.1 DUF973 family protein [Pyrobaculum aerophilum]